MQIIVASMGDRMGGRIKLILYVQIGLFVYSNIYSREDFVVRDRIFDLLVRKNVHEKVISQEG